MAGTILGGKRAAETNKKKYGKEFYARIGAKGGKNGHTGGFQQDIPCSCDSIAEPHLKRQCAGKLGGTVSRGGGRRKYA